MSPTVFFMRTFSTRTVTSLLVSGESVLSVECRFREDPFSFWGDFSESGGEKDCRSNTQNKYLNRAKQKKKKQKKTRTNQNKQNKNQAFQNKKKCTENISSHYFDLVLTIMNHTKYSEMINYMYV